MTYTTEQEAFAEECPTLGAEYRSAHEAAERFLAHWREEHAQKLADDIMKPVMDIMQERVWDAFRDWLLSDTELNAANEMQRMVEDSVRALIGGKEWAGVKYIRPGAYRGDEVRATLAKLHADEIKDGRIADLEAEVDRLKEQLRVSRGLY